MHSLRIKLIYTDNAEKRLLLNVTGENYYMLVKGFIYKNFWCLQKKLTNYKICPKSKTQGVIDVTGYKSALQLIAGLYNVCIAYT